MLIITKVMLLGQYSVGKTTFIRYLLGRDFPGQRIGPGLFFKMVFFIFLIFYLTVCWCAEPTTDRFTALIDGPDERIIPGNALAVSHDMYAYLVVFIVHFCVICLYICLHVLF